MIGEPNDEGLTLKDRATESTPVMVLGVVLLIGGGGFGPATALPGNQVLTEARFESVEGSTKRAASSPADEGPTASDLLADFLSAYDAGTLSEFSTFCEAHYSKGRLEADTAYGGCAVRWLQLRDSFGPVVLDRTESRAFGDMHWFRSTPVGVWFGVMFIPDDEGKVRGVALDEGVVPTFAEPFESVKPEQIGQWLDHYSARLEAAGVFSGVIAIGFDDERVAARSVGLADRRLQIPNTVDTRFRIASVSKMFTAAAVLRSIDDGAIDLDSTFGRFVPAYPKAVSSQVTIRQLLNHTSGIEMDDNPSFNTAILEAQTVDDILQAHLAHLHLMNEGRFDNFTPLGEYDYSNEDYDILGMVLEGVTGTTWPDVLRGTVFIPAGIENIGFEAVGSGDAVGHSLRREISSPRLGAELRSSDSLSRAYARPAGSHLASAGDLISFMRFVDEARAADGSVFREATTIQAGTVDDPTMDLRSGYGFGFQVSQDLCGESFGHNGGTPGASSTVRHWPDRGLTIVVLANLDKIAYPVALYVARNLLPCYGDES